MVRNATAEALGQIGDARAVESLIVTLKDAVAVVRSSAVKALGMIGDIKAEKRLIEISEDYDLESVRADAKEALAKINKNKE